jgi:ribulose-bisphosphate carboxylase large chain
MNAFPAAHGERSDRCHFSEPRRGSRHATIELAWNHDRPQMSWIEVTYRVRAGRDEIADVAQALALEQSVELPAEIVRDPFVRHNIVGQVDAIRDLGDGHHAVIVRLATETTGFDVAQTINMLFGNSSLHEHVTLVDVDFPPDFLARFAGPRFGVDGIRRLLAAEQRPLTCAALKPQGLPVEKLTELCHTLACAGIDVIKDDHGLADQSYSPFAQRVAACQRALERAQRETGRRSLYAPSLVGSPGRLASQARIARDEGAQMVLVAPALIGMPAFAELVAEHLNVPVLAHPAYAGAVAVAPPLLLGKLLRLFGADAVIFPSFGGRFAYSQKTCAEIAAQSRAAWSHVRPALPVPAGGMTVERTPELVRFYGPDVMLLIGGSLLAARDALPYRARSFVDAVRRTADPQTAFPASAYASSESSQ